MSLPALVILFLLVSYSEPDRRITCNIRCSQRQNSLCTDAESVSGCQGNCSDTRLQCKNFTFQADNITKIICERRKQQKPSQTLKLIVSTSGDGLGCQDCPSDANTNCKNCTVTDGGKTVNIAVRWKKCDNETTRTQATSLPMTDTGNATSKPTSTVAPSPSTTESLGPSTVEGSSSTYNTSTSDQTSEETTTPDMTKPTEPISTASSPTPGDQSSNDDNSSPGAQKEKATGSWRIIVAVVITGVAIAVVIVIVLFLLRRKGVICARGPEHDHQMKSLDDSQSESGNPYSHDPSAPDLGESAQPHSSSRNPNDVDASRLEPSAPAYFTVEPDWMSRLASNASRDGPAASTAPARRAGGDNAYHSINDEDIRPLPSQAKDNDDYNKLGEKRKPGSDPSGSEYGHLAFGGVDDGYDHVTRGKETEVKVHRGDADDRVAEGATWVDSLDYHHVLGGAGVDRTADCGDYDTPPPPRQKDSGYASRALGQDVDAKDMGDYDYPPSPRKVKKSLNSGDPSSANGKTPSSGAYELAAPLSPGGSAGEGSAISAEGSMASLGTTPAERQESEEATPGSP